MSNPISSSLQGAVRTITIDNPPANCYSHEVMRALDEAILEARFDDRTEVILLRGSGDRFFCAGADIGMLGEVTSEWKYHFCLHANETLCRLEQTPMLTIAVLNGHCVGGGLEIALACDLRIGRREGGKIGLPEVNLGVLPGTGGTQRLVRTLGKVRALQWCISGKVVSFDEAHAEGLIQELWEPADFEERVAEFADSFCSPKRASLAVGLIKRSIQSGSEMGLTEGLALERELQQRLFISRDSAEGIAAHNEKRTPHFEGN